MRELFTIDLANYNSDGKVYSRPSVRAIIKREDKVLLVYSRKYGYYKFPGGGIEQGETDTEALVREVAEETGYAVSEESITEYGRVLRRERSEREPNSIFEQDNRYYTADVGDAIKETKLDEYEAEEGFTAVWVKPWEASLCNRYCRNAPDAIIVEREARVLDAVDLDFRKEERRDKETKAILALGNPMYKDMLAFVEEALKIDLEQISAKVRINYSRFAHTKRVLGWTKRLYDLAPDKSQLRYEDLITAAIFHDVGRSKEEELKLPHAEAGVPVTCAYLNEHGFDKERTEYICFLVGSHSDKHKMNDPNIDRNLLLLMEADLLDDMGATGIIMDAMIVENGNPKADFCDCLDHIKRYTLRQQADNPMVTPEARKIWDEKTVMVENFVKALSEDIELG